MIPFGQQGQLLLQREATPPARLRRRDRRGRLGVGHRAVLGQTGVRFSRGLHHKKAAERLGIGERTLYEKLKAYGIK